MAKSTHPPVNSIGPAREYSASSTASATIFVQGDAATSVMYVEGGGVRLSVLSHAGKEAVVAVLDGGYFFGEGLPGGPAAADGHCDGDGAVHDRGRR